MVTCRLTAAAREGSRGVCRLVYWKRVIVSFTLSSLPGPLLLRRQHEVDELVDGREMNAGDGLVS